MNRTSANQNRRFVPRDYLDALIGDSVTMLGVSFTRERYTYREQELCMYTLCFTLYYCIMYSVYSVPGFVIFAILTFPEHFVIMSLVLIRLLFYWNILVD